ncbi:MAG: hypothetical protein HOM25_05305 [Rhodospirillaceae bacterium]|nr:hypothetical protein [Rhodospirillaceae bacterium]MBT5667405.1 hypothetical protein [Rhodospirillaceae bacterium]MBT5810335.1 hypothetical protein [Rhodospirillaceae bacterium]
MTKDGFENLPSQFLLHGGEHGTMEGLTSADDPMRMMPQWSMKRATIFIAVLAALCWIGVIAAIVALT